MNRRQFIGRASSGIAAAAVLEQILETRRLFASRLARQISPSRMPDLSQAYTLSPDVSYLNHASIGTIPRLVQQVRRRYLDLCETNPWLYMWGGAWEEAREKVRARSARLLGCQPSEIAITHNTTEGFNLLAGGLPLGRGDEVLFSSLNHPGASVCWFQQAARAGFAVRRFDFPLQQAPRMSVQELLDLHDRQISPRTRVLVFPHIDNVVGLRHPAARLAQLARDRGVEFVAVDGAQSVGMIDVDLGRMGVDFYASSPHKWLQAPKGLGLFYARAQVRHALRPIWVTWGQERWKGTSRIYEDYGTRNLPEVLTLGDAIAFQQRIDPEGRRGHYRALRRRAKQLARASSVLAWRSPKEWSLGASLYAVEVLGLDSRKFFDTMFHRHGFVFRSFHSPGLNTVRLSPNLANTTGQIERFFELAERILKA